MKKFRLTYYGLLGFDYTGFDSQQEALLWAFHQERMGIMKARNLMEYDAAQDEYKIIADLKDAPVDLPLPHAGENKTYCLTHVQNKIYHEILVEAPSAEFAKRYFLSKKPNANAISALVANPGDFKPGIPVLVLTEREEKLIRDDFLSADIADLDLSVRAYNRLRRSGIVNVRQLVCKTEGQLREMRDLGWSRIDEIKSILKTFGETLRAPTEEETKSQACSFVAKQIQELYMSEELTESEMNYADEHIERISEQYLKKCNEWEEKFGKEIPLSIELDFMHEEILKVAREVFTIEENAVIFSVTLEPGYAVEVKVCTDTGLTYVMQNADGSLVHSETDPDVTFPYFKVDEETIIRMVKEDLGRPSLDKLVANAQSRNAASKEQRTIGSTNKNNPSKGSESGR